MSRGLLGFDERDVVWSPIRGVLFGMWWIQ